MKVLITAFFALFLVAGCSKPASDILNDISGVWRASDNAMVTISYKDNALLFAIGEQVIPAKIGAIDTENRTVNLNVALNTGKPGIWTLRQIWAEDKKSFHLGFTFNDGTQDVLQFVRKISADDLVVFGANNSVKSGAVVQASANAAQIENKPSTSTSNSGLYEWKSGWGQGITEYSVEDGNGNQLYIACPDGEGAVSGIATIGGASFSSDNEGFNVIVDGETYNNPFQTDCRVCANNFEPFWVALRKANNIRVSSAEKSAVIPTKNIGKTLPEFSSKENSCRVAI